MLNVFRPQAPPNRAEALLLEREGMVLSWSLAARLAFMGIMIVLTLLHLAGVTPPGIVAQDIADAWQTLAVLLAATVIDGWFFVLARRKRAVRVVGLTVALLDLAVLSIAPWIWLKALPAGAAFPPGLAKGDLFAICLLMVVINSITLRPLYPALLTLGSLALLTVIAWVTLSGPAVELTNSYVGHFRTPAVNVGLIGVRLLVLTLCGAFLTAMAFTARRTFREAIALEIANLELKERQAEMALEGRLASIKGLVAGLAHELNTPLGVVRSGLDTTEAWIAKLLPEQPDEPAQLVRARRVLLDAGVTARQGVERMHRLVETLREFSSLDESEVRSSDLRQDLDTVLALMEPAKVGGVEVVREYDAIPPVRCRPRELNQAFFTILTNAFEAMRGEGRLRIATTHVDQEVRVTIADSGPGIPDDRLASLFDIRFGEKDQRIGMRMGLPTSRLIVERHAGRITVQSKAGGGTTFTLALPAES